MTTRPGGDRDGIGVRVMSGSCQIGAGGNLNCMRDLDECIIPNNVHAGPT